MLHASTSVFWISYSCFSCSRSKRGRHAAPHNWRSTMRQRPRQPLSKAGAGRAQPRHTPPQRPTLATGKRNTASASAGGAAAPQHQCGGGAGGEQGLAQVEGCLLQAPRDRVQSICRLLGACMRGRKARRSHSRAGNTYNESTPPTQAPLPPASLTMLAVEPGSLPLDRQSCALSRARRKALPCYAATLAAERQHARF